MVIQLNKKKEKGKKTIIKVLNEWFGFRQQIFNTGQLGPSVNPNMARNHF
jgi:hypothetical protein